MKVRATVIPFPLPLPILLPGGRACGQRHREAFLRCSAYTGIAPCHQARDRMSDMKCVNDWSETWPDLRLPSRGRRVTGMAEAKSHRWMYPRASKAANR